MEDIAKRFMKHDRILSKNAHEYLTGRPALISRIESLLDEGGELPLIIDVGHIRELDLTDDRPEEGPRDDAAIQEDEGSEIVHPKEDPGPEHESTGSKHEEIKDMLQDIPGSVSKTLGRGRTTANHSPVKRRSGPGGEPIPLASEYPAEIEILRDMYSDPEGQGKIEDFKNLFMDRFRSMREILLYQYSDLYPNRDIYDLQTADDTVRFTGIINSIRSTKNGHIMVRMEDPTGSIKVLLSKTKKELEGVRLVNDEVIGIIGKYKPGNRMGGPIVFADRVFKVDIPMHHKRRLSPVKGLTAAFTSDIHIGSRNYLEKEWDRMVKWLRGESSASLPSREGTRVKYLVIAGDLVDGIGTYPNQERDLAIKDIYGQYEALAESLHDIPDHVEIIMIPGNHDVVRLAEPQPVIPKDFQEIFSYDNIHFMSNPTYFSIHGVNVLGYHGKSFDDMVTIFKDVSYEDPVPGMVEMLRSRHLSPAYGMRNQLAPAESDRLIIKDVPDIFVTGHVHSFGIGYYKGVQLVQGSTWQSQTDYQKMMNFKPQPAKMGIVELDKPKTQRVWEIT